MSSGFLASASAHPPIGTCRVSRLASQPARIGPGQGVGCLVVVPAPGVDGAEDDLVSEHELTVHGAEVSGRQVGVMGEAGQGDRCVRADTGKDIGQDRADSGAFDDDLRLHGQL